MIERCDYADVEHFRARAAREGASVKDSRDTTWFRAVNDVGGTIGCAALIDRDGIGRIKAVYVLPHHRGQGVGDALNRHLIGYAEDLGLSAVEAYARDPGWYDRNGFRRLGVRPNGGIHVIRNL